MLTFGGKFYLVRFGNLSDLIYSNVYLRGIYLKKVVKNAQKALTLVAFCYIIYYGYLC